MLRHTGTVAGGSPLYQLSPEHVAGVVALGAFVIGALWYFRGRPLPRLAAIDWLLVALLAISSAVHAGLAIGHDDGGITRILFLADAVALAVVARRIMRGSRAGLLGVAVLVGSIAAYWPAVLTQEAPDQLGLATKLIEIAALAIVLRPRGRVRAFVANAFITLLVLVTATTSWIGAFRASAHDEGAIAAHHVHAGGVAPPGAVLPAVPQRAPTDAEVAAANQLVNATRIALEKYADPANAAKDGYNVAGLAGLDFHASNAKYEHDGRTLDPERPETLVYAVAPDGRPVLLGAMFMMEELHQPGPTPGGPLTMWHAHEHVCISLAPFALAGLLDPLGMCPLGSLDLPLTAQMMHVWVVPGAPTQFGDLDDNWKRAYLAAVARR
jgi:hypothetical protein